jgi:hypothetical protein
VVIKRLADAHLIKKIFEDVWDSVTDDGCGAFENFVPDIKNPNKYFITIEEHNSLICLVMLNKITHTLAECHLIVCKKFRGKNLTINFEKVRDYILENTSIRNLITMLPKSRKYIYNYSLQYGWKEKCTIKNAFQKDGKLEDMILLELEI